MSKRKKNDPLPLKVGGVYACVYHKSFPNGKERLGRYDTEETKKETDKAYRQFITEWAYFGGVADSHNQKSYSINDLALKTVQGRFLSKKGMLASIVAN